jgi:spermidine/putrescine transport system ATP-binding protein
MNGGRVEQVAGPKEIYEQPSTAFVADFIGSLNTLDFTVDEIVGEYGIMRPSEGERVVVALAPGTRTGESLRVAVRPERVQIGATGDALPDAGTRLEGTISQIVYLGMYTQFHVNTRIGAVVSHRLADETAGQFDTGRRIALSWDAEHTSRLDGAASTGSL